MSTPHASAWIRAVDTRHGFYRARGLLLAVFFAWLLLGCSTLYSPDEHLVEPDAKPLAEPSLPYRIGLMPLFVDEAYRQRLEDVHGRAGNREFAYLPDEELALEFTEELVEALEQLEAFEDVQLLARTAKLQPTLHDAWEEGLDLVIRPVLRRYDCRYVGSTDAYIPSLIIWFAVLQGITWWIAEETFESETALALEFYTTTGEPDPLLVREIHGEVRCNLNDFQRGFNLFNLFKTPGGLSESQWHTIGNNLLPLSRQEAQRAMLAELTVRDEAGLAAELEALEARLRRRLAIVCGVQAHPGLGRRYAVADALKMRELLLDSPAAPIHDERALLTLEGGRATRGALRNAIDQLFVRRGRARDDALLFVAGQGVIDANGRAWILLAGADPEALSPTTALPVDELATWLDALETPVSVIASISWNAAAPESEPTAPLERDPASGELEDHVDPWTPFAELSRVRLYSATSGPNRVLEIDSVGGCLFVDELVHVLTEAAPLKGERAGSWPALTETWFTNVRQLSMFDGHPQTPQAFGDTATPPPSFFVRPEVE